MYTIFNQTTQPQELSDGEHLGAGASLSVERIGERESALVKNGIISIREERSTESVNSENSTQVETAPQPPAPEATTKRRHK